MRIAYLFYGDAYELAGVGMKIRGQTARWRDAGHEVEVVAVTPAPTGARAPAFPLRAFPFAGIGDRAAATVRAARHVRRLRPDLVYLRYDRFVPPVGPLLWPLRTVVEINTDDRREMALYGRAAGLYNEAHRRLTLPLASGFVCVTHELARACVAPFGKPVAVISNGVEPLERPPAPPAPRDRRSAVLLVGALPVGSWIGLDRVAELARAIPELDVHLIGMTAGDVGVPLPPSVTAHGPLSREGYGPLMAGADFAIGPLALFRKGMDEASPLKVRESLLHGLPVLMGHEDTDFVGEDPWFLLRLPNREDNVREGIDAVRGWVDGIAGRRVAPGEIGRLAPGAKEEARLAFMEDVAGGAAAVPPLKPRPYYLAVDRWERLRTARVRRLPALPAPPGVRLLGYHRVADERDVLAVTPDALRRQVEAVRASGASIVPLEEALALLRERVAEAYVCITFDDGYRDMLEVAAPLLAELGATGTLFLPSLVPGSEHPFPWYRGAAPPALSRDEVRELVAGGVIDVQSHSRSHPRLTAVGDGRAREEIAGSKAELEALVGRPVTSFSYPGGLYGPREVALVRQAGYRAGITCRGGINVGGGPAWELRRTMVSWGDDDERFRAKLSGRLDRTGLATELMQRRRARARRVATTPS